MNDQAASEPRFPVAAIRPYWRRTGLHLLAFLFVTLLFAYLAVAYLFLPLIWINYAHRHPALDATPGISYTSDDHPGDPINVGLIGSEAQVRQVMATASWYPADPVTLESSLEIAAGTVLRRPYDDAPVSPLYLWGHKQALAFEKPVGDDPRRRHHVRFWKSDSLDDQGRPFWAGSVTYDERVGLSHTTGEITHHIGPDVDAERDHLFQELKDFVQVQVIDGFHKVLSGKNGGGDPWHTDGRLFVGVISSGSAASDGAANTGAKEAVPSGL